MNNDINVGVSGGITIDLGTLLLIIGAIAVLILVWLLLKKIWSVPSGAAKKLRRALGKGTVVERLQDEKRHMQEEIDKLTYERGELAAAGEAVTKERDELLGKYNSARNQKEVLENELKELREKNEDLNEYVKFLLHRIEIGEREMRREEWNARVNYVKGELKKGADAVINTVDQGIGLLENAQIKYNAKKAAVMNKLLEAAKSEPEKLEATEVPALDVTDYTKLEGFRYSEAPEPVDAYFYEIKEEGRKEEQ